MSADRLAGVTAPLRRRDFRDGGSFIDQYRPAAKPPASIILLSAAHEVEESAKRLDVAAYIRKPFELEELRHVIGRCLADS